MAKDSQSRPAEQLQGARLDGGWTVIEKVLRNPEENSGGTFSTGYVVMHDDGHRGFLKAMDYAEAIKKKNAPDEMKRQLDSYIFERDLCIHCRDRRMSSVLHAITHGSYIVDPEHPMSEFFKVEYLIFELADEGDIRIYLDSHRQSGPAFKLRALHNVANGLRQLHMHGIAHQDIKPSNIMVFNGGELSKVGDLGRAWVRGMTSPYDGREIAGDAGYAPYELRYSFVASLDDRQRRFGCDLYLLGSMFVFLFVGVPINALIHAFLHPNYQATKGIYEFSEFLPYLEEAFSETLHQFSRTIPDYLPELTGMVEQLCHPDPVKRGQPIRRKSNQFSLEWYVSKLDYLVKKADVQNRLMGA